MPTRAMRDPIQQPPTLSATATPAVKGVTQGIAKGMRKAMGKGRLKGRTPETRQHTSQHTTQRTLRPHVGLTVWFLGSLGLVNPLANPVWATTGPEEGPEALVTGADPVATGEPHPWWGADPWTSPDRPFLYYGEKRPEPSEDAEPLPLPQPHVLLVSPAGSVQGQTPVETPSVVPVVPTVPVVIGNGGQRDAVTSIPTAEPARGQAVPVDRQSTEGKKEMKETATTEMANQSDESAGKRADPLTGQVVVTPNGDTLVIVGGVAYPYKASAESKATQTTATTAPNAALHVAENATANPSANPSGKATEADAPVPLTTIKTLPELKAERQKRLERAVMNPSPDNMRAYLEVNAFMLGKSHAFAANFERSRLLNPTLDWTATHPTANFAQVEAKEATRTLQEQYLKHVSQASALWLMVDDTDGQSLASHADEKGASARGTTESSVATDAGTLALQAQFQDLMLQSTKAFAQSYGFPLYVIVRLHETPNSPAFATRLAAWRQRLLSSRVLGLPVNTRETTASSTASTLGDAPKGSSRTSSESSAKPAKEATADATPSVITAVLPDLGHTAALGLVELPAVLFIPDMKALNHYPEFLRVKGALAGKDALLLATGVVSSNELARRLMSLLKAEVDPTSNRREVIPGVGLTPSLPPNAVTGATPVAPTLQPTTVTGTTSGTHPHSTQP